MRCCKKAKIMHSTGNKHNIGIFLPPSPRGPGMIKSPALDVANMIAILKENLECTVSLFDFRAHVIAEDAFWTKKTVDLGVFNNFRKCIRHLLVKKSAKIDDTVQKILKEAEIAGVNLMIFFVSIMEQFSLQYLTSALCIAHELKKNNPSIKIILSGNCPKRHIRQIMHRFEFLDAFLEEGNEYAILEYIKKFSKYTALRGVTYRKKNKINPPTGNLPLQLNEYPIPDFSLFDLEIYKSNGKLVFPYELSRGCINNCFFCYYIYKGGKVYKKRYEKAVKDLIFLKKKYKVNIFHFIDAEINFDNNYLRKFCEELLAKKAGIFWSALAIPADLNYDLLKLMRKSGCVQLRLGVESGGPHLLKRINKNTTVSGMSGVLRRAHQAGIHTYVTLIHGLPLETIEDILETNKFLRKNKEYIDSVDICDYGRLGHFEIQILGILSNKREGAQKLERAPLTGRLLRAYSQKIGFKKEDIIEDFLTKREL